jgi:hypothetical protein
MQLNLTCAATLLCAAATLTFAFSDDTFQGNVVKKPFDAALHGQAAKTTSNQILYHGGPVMNKSNSVYVIYYGSFPATTDPIINDFLVGLSGSVPYQVNHTYNDPTAASPAFIPINYTFAAPVRGSTANPNGSVYFDNYSQGSQLSASAIPKVVAHAITSGFRAPDANGVYLVITAPDVKISGLCTSYCAYHNASTAIVSGMSIRFALIPDATQKCTGCNGGVSVYGDTVTPNGDMGADTMTDDIMHELSETVTDPDISAWYTQNGAENGDLCNYVYDTPTPSLVKTVLVGGAVAHYNATLNGRNFLIQLLWKNSGAGFCAAQ